MENKCPDNCNNCKDSRACVPFFAHENVLMHYGRVNRRSMITTVCVCIMAVVLVAIFVIAYTVRENGWAVREKYLVDTIIELRTPAQTEVPNGIYQQSDP